MLGFDSKYNFSLTFIIIASLIFLSTHYVMADEVREYNGRRLSSVYDFPENSIKGPQRVDIAEYRLEVTGLVERPLSLAYKDVLSGWEPVKKIMRINCVEGWRLDLLWEGVVLEEILNKAGIKPGTKTVIFHSVDGYTTSLPLDYIIKKKIILAYKINGLTLPSERGFPFQVAAEGKWGYKWAKWVSKIELSSDADYRGFWEKRGYNRDGDDTGQVYN